MEGPAARVFGKGCACRGAGGASLYLGGRRGLPGPLLEVPVSCRWFAALFGPLNPCVAGLCALRVLQQIPPPAWPPQAPPSLPTGLTHVAPANPSTAEPSGFLSFGRKIPSDANPCFAQAWTAL